MNQLSLVLQQYYGLRVREATHIDYGMWEESFRVETDRGRFFAKRFMRKDRKLDVMIHGLELSERLRLQGFPTPRLVPTRDGDLLAHHEGERYQVTEWVEGQGYRAGRIPPAAVAAMGALLGRFHRLTGPAEPQPEDWFESPVEAAGRCEALLARYAGRPEPFAAFAREVLQEQVAVLRTLPRDFHVSLPAPALGGHIYNSFWVEQVLFKPDGQVAALVDWTDGTGRVGYWAGDLDCAIHVSGLDHEATLLFAKAYQAENPLPPSEWRVVAALLCYGHLASTNFLSSWLTRPYRRMDGWEETSMVWHGQILPRFRQWGELEAELVNLA